MGGPRDIRVKRHPNIVFEGKSGDIQWRLVRIKKSIRIERKLVDGCGEPAWVPWNINSWDSILEDSILPSIIGLIPGTKNPVGRPRK